MSKRRGRRTKRKFPVWLIVIVAILIVLVAAVTIFLQRRNAPSTETVDLDSYFRLTAHSVTNADGETTDYKAAEDDEIAIVMDDMILNDIRGIVKDGEAYLKYSFVKRVIDSRFYYDSVNDMVLVTNALQTVQTAIGSNEYTIDGQAQSQEHPLAIWRGEVLYLSQTFIDEFSNVKTAMFDDPGRIYVQTQDGKVQLAEVEKATEIREAGGNKSAIVAKVDEGTSVTILEEVEGWSKVVDEHGVPGYINSAVLTNQHEETLTSDYDEPEYTHIDLGAPINMVWHGVFYYGQDMEIYNLGANMTGVNVLSPRWYNMDLSEDYIELLSSPEYMSFAHENGYKVWAMVTDDLLETDNVMDVLMDTYKRQTFIRTMVDDANLEGVDGLNVDFEKINQDFGDDYIEFIRELSIECRKSGIVLSVDNYTPYSYNAAFHIDQQSQCADYVMVMAYDHYVGTDEIGPNSSVDFLEEVMDVTLPQVDVTRLVIGLPFYSRYWYNRGGSDLKNETFSMYDAVQYLADRGIETKWDDTTCMNTAQFEEDGTQIYAWVEDAKSIDAKLKFLKDYPIAGVAWWNLGQQTDDVWETISKYY